jgi:hypothetical protein
MVEVLIVEAMIVDAFRVEARMVLPFILEI